MRIWSVILALSFLTGNAWACDDLAFADALKAGGYEELAISTYEDVVKSKKIIREAERSGLYKSIPTAQK